MDEIKPRHTFYLCSISRFTLKHSVEVKWAVMQFHVDFEEHQIAVIKLLMWCVIERALDEH